MEQADRNQTFPVGGAYAVGEPEIFRLAQAERQQERHPEHMEGQHPGGRMESVRLEAGKADTGPVSVAVCETQPLTAEGLASVLRAHPEFQLTASVYTLADAGRLLSAERPPRILVLDKTFGMQAVLDWMSDYRALAASTSVVIWGLSISEAEALRFLQTGAKGIIRKVAAPAALVTCLRSVARGSSWMEDSLFRESSRPDKSHRSELTPREQQVMALVEQGSKNKDIAKDLGIRPGTVKIHLKHIFEKTGVRGRYGLALSGMKDKGMLP